ncbi:hypothetical protein GCM10023238_24260 [Streptomyces heliomycini]
MGRRLLTGNLHKWGCAPRGTAALVARGPLREGLYPLIDSWGAADPYPDRFDQQGTLDATGPAGRGDGPRLRRPRLGLARRPPVHGRAGRLRRADRGRRAHRTDRCGRVRRRRHARARHAAGAAARRPRESRIAADALRDRAPAELGVEAAFTSFRGVGYLRLSAHVYNTAEDYEYFAEKCVPVLGEWARAAR